MKLTNMSGYMNRSMIGRLFIVKVIFTRIQEIINIVFQLTGPFNEIIIHKGYSLFYFWVIVLIILVINKPPVAGVVLHTSM